ncbi:uncharacterized protein LOC133883425 [Phragmites australis]|uniref:uncharacterized protein LOC133883425 n=1 Tax=Phragmites australis TaxID=29695 RepID=UPI002D79ED5F|nr:uncharacterized protein LOC133883425 [Phragmites australis]
MNMASSGYYSPYYQPAPYYYNYSQQQQQRARGGGGGQSSVYVFIFLATVSLLAATTLYAWCESAVESLVDQLRRFLILSPLLLILAVQLWVATGGERRAGGGGGGIMCLLAELVMGDQRGQYGYRAGGSSPWGVALALVLVLFLISYQSSLQERWFPRLGR